MAPRAWCQMNSPPQVMPTLSIMASLLRLSMRSARTLSFPRTVLSRLIMTRASTRCSFAFTRGMFAASCFDTAFATERDPSVSLNDPAEEEAQKLLESGTSALEVGELQNAMVYRV